MWKEIVARCAGFFSREDVRASGRVLEVRYEQLVTRPDEVGSRALRHLGARPSRRALARLRTAHSRSIGVHRRRDPAEIAAAERIAGAELRRLGYEVSGPGGAGTGPA
jgi:hypothetical protein